MARHRGIADEVARHRGIADEVARHGGIANEVGRRRVILSLSKDGPAPVLGLPGNAQTRDSQKGAPCLDFSGDAF